MQVNENVQIRDDQVPVNWDSKIFSLVTIDEIEYAVISPKGSPLYLVAVKDLVKTNYGWTAHEHDLIHGHLIGTET